MKVFISCSAQDRAAHDLLIKHLKRLIDEKQITICSEASVTAGNYVKAETLAHIDQASFALLILTADYLSCQHCDEQRDKMVKARSERGLRILPVLWSACDWEEVPLSDGHKLGELKPLNPEPIIQTADRREEELAKIARELRRLISTTRSISAPSLSVDAAPSQVSGVLPASAVSAPAVVQQPSDNESHSAYVVELEADTTSVDVLDLIERLKKSEPKSWLWNGGAFTSLTKGRGDNKNRERRLRVSWSSEAVVVEMNPVGFSDNHPLPEITSPLVRSSRGDKSKKYRYHPFGKSQPQLYEVDVRFGSQISVLITDLSATLPDLKKTPALRLIWTGVSNQGGFSGG